MTPEQQRIAIAEACGWAKVRKTTFGLFGCHPDADLSVLSDEYLCVRPLPDYLNDLNAMHEAEKILTYDQFDEYYVQLSMKMVRPFHATAAQRAEAFLRTIGKWKEARK